MKKIALALAASIALAACDKGQPQQQYVQQPAPQVQQYQQPYQQPPVQQYAAPQQGISTGTAVLGAAAIGAGAYYLGKNSAPKTETKTVVVQQPAPTQYNYSPAAQAPAPQPKPAVTSSAPTTFKPVAASKAVTVTPPKTSISFRKR